MSLESGHQLLHYRIVSRLGAGGMGEVYRAEDTKLGRVVAVKVLPADTAADPTRLVRLQQRARARYNIQSTGLAFGEFHADAKQPAESESRTRI